MAGSAALAPFRHRLFTWLWVGNATSALGTWIQSTASAWVMTDLAPDPLMVSLNQAAAQLPILLLALPAGALADLVDRRRFLIWTNSAMLATSAALAIVYAAGLIGAWSLLGFTALLAAFAAMNSPAWASSVPLTVPREDLPQALVLNSIGFNVARAAGPAIGGLIVASAGAALAFAANAATFAVVALLVGTVLVIARTDAFRDLPPEPAMRAMGMGLRYAKAEPAVRAALARSAAYYACASAIWALLPLYVRDTLGLGSAGYGIMLGAIGAGAVIGGIVMTHLRALLSRDGLVVLAGLLTGLSLVPVALVHHPLVAITSMLAYGFGWIVGASNLQATVQLACAPWVRARGLAIYQAVYNGSMGIGAIAWGWLGTHLGLTDTLLVAGIGGLAVALLARRLRLPADMPDPSLPATRPPPTVNVDEAIALSLAAERRPVLVTIAYTIDAADEPAFRAAMKQLAEARRRDGAVAWLLTRDIERPSRWVEAFRMPDWHELLRAVARRNVQDEAAAQTARALHRGDSPELHVLVIEQR